MPFRSALVVSLLAVTALPGEVVRFKDRCLGDLVSAVPGILASQDRKTGRFGQGIWIVTDQNVMLPLAAAWSFKHANNPYYHKRELLDAVMAAGDALIADADADGMWEFRKKDGSTWGKIYMPWTYSRWMRSYRLIRDAMPPDHRARWSAALRLGFTGIAAQLTRTRLHDNIYAHHAMALYLAGQEFGKPEWCALAAECLRIVMSEQNPAGYWVEHSGPVVVYSPVYLDALGIYYSASRDESVLTTLRRAALFHTYFTYPDGSPVETIDERNPYHGGGGGVPNVGFTLTPEGRTYFARRLREAARPINPDLAATLLLTGEEGPGLDRDPLDSDFDYILGDREAAVRRRGPWYLVVSALTAPPAQDSSARWWMDRQNFVSVYHDKVGLILGGGNSKLQPYWSTFTIGDTSRFHFMPAVDGKEPNFLPPSGLRHIPTSARLLLGDDFGVELDYAGQRFVVRLKPLGPDRLECTYRALAPSVDGEVVAHVTVYPRYGAVIKSEGGEATDVSDKPFRWAPGAWIEHAGFRISVPGSATVHGPELPWNPYTKDGSALPHSGLLVIDLPITGESPEQRITVDVLGRE